MWWGLFAAALLADMASFAIWRHQLVNRTRTLVVSPVVGNMVGGVEIALAVYVLIAWSWTGFRDMRADGRETPRHSGSNTLP